MGQMIGWSKSALLHWLHENTELQHVLQVEVLIQVFLKHIEVMQLAEPHVTILKPTVSEKVFILTHSL